MVPNSATGTASNRLTLGIMPFIVLNSDKPFYMRGLKNYKEDKMFLIDTIKHEQDLYESVVCEMLDFKLNDE